MRTNSRELLAVGIFGSKSRIGDRIEMLLRRGRAFSTRASATGVIASAIALCGLMVVASFAPRWIAFAQRAVPSFEVASIKPAPPLSGRGVVFGMPDVPDRFTGYFVTLTDLMTKAYGVEHARISGGALLGFNRPLRRDRDAPNRRTTRADSIDVANPSCRAIQADCPARIQNDPGIRAGPG